MILTATRLDRDHYETLHQIVDQTLLSGVGWNIKSLATATEIVDYIYAEHDLDGCFWTLQKDEKIIGFTGYIWRDDQLSKGFSSISYLCPSARGGQINLMSKDILTKTLGRYGFSLQSRVAVGNERSNRAIRKILQEKGQSWDSIKGFDNDGREFNLYVFPLDSHPESKYWTLSQLDSFVKDSESLLKTKIAVSDGIIE